VVDWDSIFTRPRQPLMLKHRIEPACTFRVRIEVWASSHRSGALWSLDSPRAVCVAGGTPRADRGLGRTTRLPEINDEIAAALALHPAAASDQLKQLINRCQGLEARDQLTQIRTAARRDVPITMEPEIATAMAPISVCF
jgi:hypothetical protein